MNDAEERERLRLMQAVKDAADDGANLIKGAKRRAEVWREEATQALRNYEAALKDGRASEVCEDQSEITDVRLIRLLRKAGDEWGPLGVALAAAKLTDRDVLVAELQGTVNAAALAEGESSEQRYTLDEAERVLAERECLREGHDLEWLTRDGELVSVYCGRCSRKWAVSPERTTQDGERR